MNALILVCVYAISAHSPQGTVKTVQLSPGQAQRYEQLKAINVVDSEESYSEFEIDYLTATCAKTFHHNPDLSYLKGGAQ